MSLPPVLLVHGTVGSKMKAQSRTTTYSEDAWVNAQLIPRPMMATKVANDLWGAPNPSTMWVESHINKYVEVVPYPGLDGARRLLAIKGLEGFLRRKRIGYYYETFLQWFKKYFNYEEGVSIDAFSYDWRQEIGHPWIQEELRKTIKKMRKNNGGQKITIIGHSLGGLVVQAYMQTYLDWNDDICRFVAISVPFDGVGGYSVSGFITGYCLRLPIPSSCGRGIQGSSGSIISMAGRPGGNIHRNSFISTNIYIKKLKQPRNSSNNNADKGAEKAHQNQLNQLGDKDLEQVKFKITLDISPYKRSIPSIAYCILEKIQQNPSLLTKNVKESLLLLQRCCRRKAVKLNIDGVDYVRPRNGRRMLPEYAFNRSARKLSALPTPEELGTISVSHESKLSAVLTKILEDVVQAEDGFNTVRDEKMSHSVNTFKLDRGASTVDSACVPATATATTMGTATATATLSTGDEGAIALDIDCAAMTTSVRLHYSTEISSIPITRPVKAGIMNKNEIFNDQDFPAAMLSCKSDNCMTDVTEDYSTSDAGYSSSAVTSMKYAVSDSEITGGNSAPFKLIDNELGVVQNEHTGNPVFTWECYTPWAAYTSDNKQVIPQAYDSRKAANIFNHPDFVFTGSTVTIREDSDFMHFYRETGGGFHSTEGRVIKWSEYRNIKHFSEITMLMDELGAEYEAMPAYINYKDKIVQTRKLLFNYPELPRLKKERKVKKVNTGEPKHLPRGTDTENIAESIVASGKKMALKSIYVKERVPSAYAKSHRDSLAANTSVASRFMSRENSRSSSASSSTSILNLDDHADHVHHYEHDGDDDDEGNRIASDLFAILQPVSTTDTSGTSTVTKNTSGTATTAADADVSNMRHGVKASKKGPSSFSKVHSRVGSRVGSRCASRRTSRMGSQLASRKMSRRPSFSNDNSGPMDDTSVNDAAWVESSDVAARKDKERVVLTPYANPWSDLTLRRTVVERSIAELMNKVSEKGTLDSIIFPKFEDCWSYSAKRQAKEIKYPANPADFRYLGLLTYGRQTPIHVVYPKPIEKYSELLDQIPTFVTGQGDGTVILSSMLNDGIPDQYVDDKIIDYGVSHFNILHNFAAFTRIALFMGLSLQDIGKDNNMSDDDEQSYNHVFGGNITGVIDLQKTANTRVLRTFTVTGDEQGVLGGFFRVLVNTIEIHGESNLLVRTDSSGDCTHSAGLWYDLLQSVCDGSFADDVVISLQPLISYLGLAPIVSVDQYEAYIARIIASLPESLRNNVFDHDLRCSNCTRTSHHTLLNFLRFDSSGSGLLDLPLSTLKCPMCAFVGTLSVVHRPLLSVSTILSSASFSINQHQQLAPDYRVYNTAFMTSNVIDDPTGVGRHIESYTVFINTGEKRGPNDDFVLYSFMGSTLRREAGDKAAELTFLKTKKVAAFQEGVPGNQLRQKIGLCRIIFYMDTRSFAADLRRQLSIPMSAPKQDYLSPVYAPPSLIQPVVHTQQEREREPLKLDSSVPLQTMEMPLQRMMAPRTRTCCDSPCTCMDCSGVCSCCRHLKSEGDECCNCNDDDNCCGRHLLLWIVIIIMAVFLLILFILVIALYVQIGTTFTVRNLMVSNLSVLGPSAVTTTFRMRLAEPSGDTYVEHAQRAIVETIRNRAPDLANDDDWMAVPLTLFQQVLETLGSVCDNGSEGCPVTDSLLDSFGSYVKAISAYKKAALYPSFYPHKGEKMLRAYLDAENLQHTIREKLSADRLSGIFVTAPPTMCPTPTVYGCHAKFQYLQAQGSNVELGTAAASLTDLTLTGTLTSANAIYTGSVRTAQLEVTGSAKVPNLEGIQTLSLTNLTATNFTATNATATNMTATTGTVITSLQAINTTPAGGYVFAVASTGAQVKQKLEYLNSGNTAAFSVTDTGMSVVSAISLASGLQITNAGDITFKGSSTATPSKYNFIDNTIEVTKTNAADKTTVTSELVTAKQFTGQISVTTIADLCITNSIQYCPALAGQPKVPIITIDNTNAATPKAVLQNIKMMTAETATVSTLLTTPVAVVGSNLSLGTAANFDFAYKGQSNNPATPASITINTAIKSGATDVMNFTGGGQITWYLPVNFTKDITVSDTAAAGAEKVKITTTGAVTVTNGDLTVSGGKITVDKAQITVTPPP